MCTACKATGGRSRHRCSFMPALPQPEREVGRKDFARIFSPVVASRNKVLLLPAAAGETTGTTEEAHQLVQARHLQADTLQRAACACKLTRGGKQAQDPAAGGSCQEASPGCQGHHILPLRQAHGPLRVGGPALQGPEHNHAGGIWAGPAAVHRPLCTQAASEVCGCSSGVSGSVPKHAHLRPWAAAASCSLAQKQVVHCRSTSLYRRALCV